MGGYEPDPQPWTTGDVPNDWEFRLFDDDWDHFDQHMEQAIARVPALAEAGVKQMINGPESFTPDGNFILGRAPECANMYVGAGFNAFGIASGGGAGWVLAAVGGGGRGADGPLGRRHPPLLGPPPRPAMGLRAHLRGLRQALHRRLPARGDGERPPAHRLAALRPAEGAPGGVRLEARLGAAELVRARRRWSRATSTPWAARTGSDRSARSTALVRNAVGRLRPVVLRQVRGDGPRRGTRARPGSARAT